MPARKKKTAQGRLSLTMLRGEPLICTTHSMQAHLSLGWSGEGPTDEVNFCPDKKTAPGRRPEGYMTHYAYSLVISRFEKLQTIEPADR